MKSSIIDNIKIDGVTTKSSETQGGRIPNVVYIVNLKCMVCSSKNKLKENSRTIINSL